MTALTTVSPQSSPRLQISRTGYTELVVVVVAVEVMMVLCYMSVKPVGTVKSAYLVEVVVVMIVVVAGILKNELQKVDASGPKFSSTKERQ